MSEENKDAERARVVDAMCMTWRHDFGLDRKDDELGSCGMTDTERDALRRQMGQLYDHHFAARSLPGGVPDGLRIAIQQRDHYAARVGALELGLLRIADDFYPDNDSEMALALGEMREAVRSLVAAAPTVKAEHWKCEQCGASTGESCNANGCFANERAPDEAPSLPAAGLAVEEVEVRGLQWLDTGHYRKKPPQFGYNPHDWNPLMTVAQHQRIVAALSTQQSAPERVSVPRELLADLISSDHDTKIQAERALYALLASHGRGEA